MSRRATYKYGGIPQTCVDVTVQFHKPELALLDTSKLNRLKNTLAENGLRTACWVTLPRRVVL